MKKTRTYQVIDLALFALMTVFFEALLVTAGVRWFPAEAYMVSVTPVITAIVMMRWGAWAALHAVLGGAVTCLAAGMAEGRFLAVYCVGNLGALLALALRAVGARRKGAKAVAAEAAAASESAALTDPPAIMSPEAPVLQSK